MKKIKKQIHLLSSKKYREILVRFWLSFLILSSIPLLISGLISYNKSSNSIEEKISMYAVELTKQISTNISYELKNSENLCNDFVFENSMRHGIAETNINDSYGIIELERKFKNEISDKFFASNSIENVLVLLNNNKIIKYSESELIKNIDYKEIRYLCSNSYGKPIYLFSKIKNDNKLLLIKPVLASFDNKQAGIMILVINTDLFKKALLNVGLDSETNLFILNSDGILIYDKNDKNSSDEYPDDNLINSFKENKNSLTWIDSIEINNKNHFIACTNIQNTNFYVVETVPYNFLKKESYSIGLAILLISIISLTFAILVSGLLAANISKPIEALVIKERIDSLTQMITSISHNTKTSITSISGQNYIINDLVEEIKLNLDNKKTDKTAIKNNLEEIANSTKDIKIHLKHVNNLISTVKNHFSKKHSNSFILNNMLEHIKLLLDFELRSSNCKLIIKNSLDNEFKVNSDQNSIIQVINNLISNAIYEYRNKGGTIELIIEKKDQNILFVVKDNAGGINDEIKPKLFNEMVTTKGRNGSGLGLYVSNLIITGEIKGTMWFESIDSSTAFYIEIPNKQIN
ncbi:MAG: ATP-binding protein [Clostridiales bacterium]